MRPALLPQRESGAVLYSSHAHCKNIREQIQTIPALPTQEHTGACSDRPALHSFPSYAAAARAIACRLSLPGHRVQAQPAGPLRVGLACRAIACRLSLPGHCVRA